jgi:SPP1 family predicted phage head-tail adaptor
MSLKAGRLRHRVAIQSKANVQDPVTGEMVPTWTTVTGWGSVPAAIEPLSAREFIAAQAVQSAVTARITLRYRAGLDASMRIVHNGTIYNIAGVLADPDSGLEYVTIPCSQGVNNG